MTDGADVLRFSLLGPLRARRGGTELALGSPQQRAVLAVLLLRRGRAAGLAELADAVWGHTPPAGAVPMLRTYVSRLRRLLEPGRAPGEPPRLVVSAGDGYALRATGISTDLGTFEEGLARAEQRRAAGDNRGAARLLDTALAAWQGPALGGVPGPFARAERARLAERRLGAQEYRLRVELELGRHEAALPELRALREAQPLRETVCELLLVALARSGRQAEALDVYARARRALVVELGVEPGPSLRAAHARLLSGTTDLPPPPAPAPGAAPGAAPDAPAAPAAPDSDRPGGRGAAAALRPSQLPADLALFTGRESELGLVEDLLPAVGHPDRAVVALVNGIAGVGKTTLAVHWAHRVAAPLPRRAALRQPARVRPRAARRATRARRCETSSERWACPRSGPRRSSPAQAALYRSLLAGRRMLVVLDNARDDRAGAAAAARLAGLPGRGDQPRTG